MGTRIVATPRPPPPAPGNSVAEPPVSLTVNGGTPSGRQPASVGGLSVWIAGANLRVSGKVTAPKAKLAITIDGHRLSLTLRRGQGAAEIAAAIKEGAKIPKGYRMWVVHHESKGWYLQFIRESDRGLSKQDLAVASGLRPVMLRLLERGTLKVTPKELRPRLNLEEGFYYTADGRRTFRVPLVPATAGKPSTYGIVDPQRNEFFLMGPDRIPRGPASLPANLRFKNGSFNPDQLRRLQRAAAPAE